MASQAPTVKTDQKPSLDNLEKHYRKRVQSRVQPATTTELIWTLAIAAAVTPFFLTVFLVLPMMGQIIVGLASLSTFFYLKARRSVSVAIAAILGSGAFACLIYFTIQALKARLDVPLFIFLVLGIPVTAFYCVFLSMRIWVLRGGEQ